MEKIEVKMVVNGKPISVNVKPYARLLDVIREELGLTGTKEGCGVGECGACTVIVDNKSVNSCLTLAASMEGKHITTIEGLMENEKLHPIQQAFIDHHALQCGFCTPGLILSTKALLDNNPNPTREEIKTGISGNLCRCTGYEQIIQAVEDVSKTYNEKK